MICVFASGELSSSCFNGAGSGLFIQNLDKPVLHDVCSHCGNIEALEYFMEQEGMFEREIKDEPKPIGARSWPLLTKDNVWVMDDGTVVGKLGDALGKMPHKIEYLYG